MVEVLFLFGLDLFRGKYENRYDCLTCGLELLDEAGVVDQTQISMKQKDVHLWEHYL